MSKLTIKLLAKELGLAVSTVSKALRDSHEISAETKAKVLEFAHKHNYVPNPYASSLRRQKSKTIAVVLPEVADSFFSLAINGIESVAREKGYHVLIYLTHESVEREEIILGEFNSGRVDGILISVSQETGSGSHIQKVINSGLPIVFFDRVCDDVATARVITDDFESSYNATQHLIEKGCKQITYLSISKNLSINKKREDGFLQALADAGMTVDKTSIVECDTTGEGNYQAIENLLKTKKRPDGIIASVEKLVPPVYTACYQLKINIPQQLKLISFTNLATSPILNPPLTTIAQPAFEMGSKAASLLFKGIEKTGFNLVGETEVINSVLQKRESSSF
jgi:LacI family transcriptional regulator